MNLLRSRLDARSPGDLPLIMGIVNTTPNSFSDGGTTLDPADAKRRIDTIVEQGVDILDIGGESTHPSAPFVPASEQIERTHEAVEYAVATGLPVSIDTMSPQVAEHALQLGACAINDVSCLRDGPELAIVARKFNACLILMHAREPMTQMPGFSVCPDDAYNDIVRDVSEQWLSSARVAEQYGVDPANVLFDPGLGFNKNAQHSLELVARLDEFSKMGHPILVGPSRKSFLTKDVPLAVHQRTGATAAACIAATAKGAAALRVHDVLEMRAALCIARDLGLLNTPPETSTKDSQSKPL